MAAFTENNVSEDGKEIFSKIKHGGTGISAVSSENCCKGTDRGGNLVGYCAGFGWDTTNFLHSF